MWNYLRSFDSASFPLCLLFILKNGEERRHENETQIIYFVLNSYTSQRSYVQKLKFAIKTGQRLIDIQFQFYLFFMGERQYISQELYFCRTVDFICVKYRFQFHILSIEHLSIPCQGLCQISYSFQRYCQDLCRWKTGRLWKLMTLPEFTQSRCKFAEQFMSHSHY